MMNEMKMTFEDMISPLDGAAGRLIVPSTNDLIIKEAMEMIFDVSTSLGIWAMDLEEN